MLLISMAHGTQQLQYDQIGKFFKFLMKNFLIKVAQILVTFWATLTTIFFFEKQLWEHCSTYVKIWSTFITTSGHTGAANGPHSCIHTAKMYAFIVTCSNVHIAVYTFLQCTHGGYCTQWNDVGPV